MKKSFLACAVAVLAAWGCSSTSQLQTKVYDDGVYTRPAAAPATPTITAATESELDNLLAESKQSHAYIVNSNGDTLVVPAAKPQRLTTETSTLVVVNGPLWLRDPFYYGDPWYRPWYCDPWDPWYRPWYWGGPFYYRSWVWDPWYPWYRPYWYGPHYYWDSWYRHRWYSYGPGFYYGPAGGYYWSGRGRYNGPYAGGYSARGGSFRTDVRTITSTRAVGFRQSLQRLFGSPFRQFHNAFYGFAFRHIFCLPLRCIGGLPFRQHYGLPQWQPFLFRG